MAAEMSATPRDIKWWRTRDQNKANGFLLEMKSFIFSDAKSVYAIDSGPMRGFQIGDPAVPPYRVRVDLFDSTDQHFEMVIAGENKGRPSFSQAEVNAIVASLTPVAFR